MSNASNPVMNAVDFVMKSILFLHTVPEKMMDYSKNAHKNGISRW